MLPLAVFGDPISHSLSPTLHQWFAQQAGLDVDYRAILAPSAGFPQQLHDFFSQGGVGANITLPHKQRVLSLVDVVQPRAALAGAANTLHYAAGQLIADNTDGVGLLADFERLRVPLADQHVLILGAGGAAQGIVGPLLDAGVAAVTVRNRTPARAHSLVAHFAHSRLHCYRENSDLRPFDLVINATAAGHGQNPAAMELEPVWFEQAKLAYDLSYGHAARPFMRTAQELLPQAAQVVDGLGMLVGQGAISFQIWTGVSVDMASALAQLEAQLK